MTKRTRPLVPGLFLVCWGALPAGAAEKGRITGRVDNPKQVSAVFAKDRMSDEKDKIYPGKVDAKTGKFVIAGLPLGAVYDLVIDHAGARLEGVDLKVP